MMSRVALARRCIFSSRRLLSDGVAGLASVERSPTNETMTYLGHPDRNVLLIGTAHVSKRSADEVRQAIESFKPDCVMVELCQGRMNKLRQEQHVPDISVEGVMRSLSSRGPEGIMNMLSKGPMGLAGEMQALMGGAGQGNQSASGLGAMGSEFTAAIAAAEALRIPVIPGDIPQEEILKGCVNGLFEVSLPTLLQKLASGQGLMREMMERMQAPAAGPGSMEEYVEQMKTRKKAEEAASSMKDVLPGVHRVLVAGRDEHMIRVLRDLPPHHRTVVAVVGMGHMAGMEEEWKLKMAKHRLRSIDS